jgi:hypothetical protein
MILVLIESQEAAGHDEVQQLQGLTGPALQWTTRNANGSAQEALMTAVFDQTLKLERTGMA